MSDSVTFQGLLKYYRESAPSLPAEVFPKPGIADGLYSNTALAFGNYRCTLINPARMNLLGAPLPADLTNIHNTGPSAFPMLVGFVNLDTLNTLQVIMTDQNVVNTMNIVLPANGGQFWMVFTAPTGANQFINKFAFASTSCASAYVITAY